MSCLKRQPYTGCIHFSKNTCQEACLPQPPPMQPDPLQLLTQVSLPFPFLSPQVKSAGTQF